MLSARRYRKRGMKIKFLCFALLIPACLLFFSLSSGAATVQGPGSCVSCHEKIQTVLPKDHPPSEGKDIGSCLTCHQTPSVAGKPNPFSANIHKSHLVGKAKLQCSFCHIIEEGKSFSLPGRESIGKPDKQTLDELPQITAEWGKSQYLGAVHSAKDVTCASCHGETLPLLDAKPTNAQCLACHGSYEALAAKTPGQDHVSRNPHNSHLGPINCTVCHKAHQVSKNYCLECHQTFKMKPIPAGAAAPAPAK